MLHDKMRNWESRKSLNVESRRLRRERERETSQLWCFSHVTTMYQKKSGRYVLPATHTGKRPRGRPRTQGRDGVISYPNWLGPVFVWSLQNCQKLAENSVLLRVLTVMFPCNSPQSKSWWRWMNGLIPQCSHHNYLQNLTLPANAVTPQLAFLLNWWFAKMIRWSPTFFTILWQLRSINWRQFMSDYAFETAFIWDLLILWPYSFETSS